MVTLEILRSHRDCGSKVGRVTSLRKGVSREEIGGGGLLKEGEGKNSIRLNSSGIAVFCRGSLYWEGGRL